MEISSHGELSFSKGAPTVQGLMKYLEGKGDFEQVWRLFNVNNDDYIDSEEIKELLSTAACLMYEHVVSNKEISLDTYKEDIANQIENISWGRKFGCFTREELQDFLKEIELTWNALKENVEREKEESIIDFLESPQALETDTIFSDSFRRLWDSYDTNGDGEVDTEVKDLLFHTLMLFRKEQKAADENIKLPSKEKLMPIVEGLLESVMKKVDKNNDGVLSKDEFILCTKILRKEWSSVLKLNQSPSQQRMDSLERTRSNSGSLSSNKLITEARESIASNIIPKKYFLSKEPSIDRQISRHSAFSRERSVSSSPRSGSSNASSATRARQNSSPNILTGRKIRLRNQIGELLSAECKKAITNWGKDANLEKFIERLKKVVNATEEHIHLHKLQRVRTAGSEASI